MIDSISMWMSGNCDPSHWTVARIAEGPWTLPGADAANGAAAFSVKSSAISSSHLSRLRSFQIA